MQLNITATTKEGSAKAIEVSELAFAQEYKESTVHQVITSYLAQARAGTHAQKNRAAVRGGGKKPWRQKGTGRARAGTIRSPLWRKGGVIFAAQPRDYSQKVNKKMYRVAMRSIFSELLRQERLQLIDTFTLEAPKTKNLLKKLGQLKVKQDVLILVDNIDENLYLASRNLPRVTVSNIEDLNPVSLIKHEYVLITVPAIKKIEGLLI